MDLAIWEKFVKRYSSVHNKQIIHWAYDIFQQWILLPCSVGFKIPLLANRASSAGGRGILQHREKTVGPESAADSWDTTTSVSRLIFSPPHCPKPILINILIKRADNLEFDDIEVTQTTRNLSILAVKIIYRSSHTDIVFSACIGQHGWNADNSRCPPRLPVSLRI